MSSQPKDIVFEEKPTGVKLNTTNQDKKMDEFRKTKNKFKETRKHDALENNPFNVAQKKPENTFQHILYILHRDSLLE